MNRGFFIILFLTTYVRTSAEEPCVAQDGVPTSAAWLLQVHAERARGQSLQHSPLLSMEQSRSGACEGTAIEANLTLDHFRPSHGSRWFYDRSQRSQWAVVDMHLHSRPFGGAPVPFEDLVSWLQRAGILFAVLNGIGQRLPSDGNCSYYLDCPGTQVEPSISNDYLNAQSVLDAEAQLSGPQGPVLITAMTFMDLSKPETILPQMQALRADYPGMFTTWAGEVNVVKQALFENNAGLAVPIDIIPQWKDFMEVLANESTPLALHCDLGSDEEPLKYLPLITEILDTYPNNTILWLHMGGMSKELTPLTPRLLQQPLYADDHAALLGTLLEKYPNLMLDLAWDVLYYSLYVDPAKKKEYVELLNAYPMRFVTGVDFVAAAGKTEEDYREQLNLTSDILKDLNDFAFQRIALGQNFFELLGLNYTAPQACFSELASSDEGGGGPVASHFLHLFTTVLGVIVLMMLCGLVAVAVLDAWYGNEPAPGEGVDADVTGINGSSVVQTACNIVKNVVGEGMLSLPAALAAGTGLVPGLLLATSLGAISGYTVSLMGRVCHTTGGKLHKDCCQALESPAQGMVMQIVNMINATKGCWTYAIVIADSGTRFVHFFGLPADRAPVLIVMALFVLTPLCLQKDLSVLSYTSFIGICGEIFIVAFMQLRYLDGSYEPEGRYFSTVAEEDRPDFGAGVNFMGVSAGTPVLFGAMFTAFMSHYNSPKYFAQLREHNPERFNRAVGLAYALCIGIYTWIMAVGYLTFGTSSQGLILNNYSENDPLAAVARVSISLAVILGFPLVFNAVRDSALAVSGANINNATQFYGSTIGLLSLIVLGGCLIDDIGILNTMGGAILGSLIMFVFPGLLCNTCHNFQLKGRIQEFSSLESQIAMLVVAFGLVCMVVAGTVSTLNAFAPGVLRPTLSLLQP
mmetsp:Transcript_34530/g.78861  ORF Transcript_34530/g.78861 Transcript_34530/m.78861 type:complete len:917 (-) Transcript_34530:117-2867(-)